MTFGTVADAAASVVAILLITGLTLAVLRLITAPAEQTADEERGG